MLRGGIEKSNEWNEKKVEQSKSFRSFSPRDQLALHLSRPFGTNIISRCEEMPNCAWQIKHNNHSDYLKLTHFSFSLSICEERKKLSNNFIAPVVNLDLIFRCCCIFGIERLHNFNEMWSCRAVAGSKIIQLCCTLRLRVMQNTF